MHHNESELPLGPHLADRLFAVADAAVAMAQAATPADAVRVLTERARRLVGAHVALTTITGADHLQVVRAASFSEKYEPAPAPDGGPPGVQLPLSRPLRLTEAQLQADERLCAELTLEHHPSLRGLLAAPLVGREGTQLGVVLLSDRYEGDFDALDEATLVQLAQIASVLLENVRLMEQMQRARADADFANRAKSDFLATMSHEIRTPINAVLGYTELIEIGISGPLTGTQREHLSRIRASSLHLLRLVEEVLDLAKVEAGKLSLETDTYALADAVDLALSLVRPQAEDRGVTLEDHCTVRREVQYRGDQNRVRQILVNLLANAVKFTEFGGTVKLDCAEVEELPRDVHLGEGSWLAVTVADSGIGVPGDMQQRIFEPFERAERGHTRRHGGSGLGLSISRRLARAMGGEITLTSKPGAGSTFTLWLPSARSAGDQPAPRTPLQLAEQYEDIPDELLQPAAASLIAATPGIMQDFAAALRQDPLFEPVRSLPEPVLTDHVSTLVSDIATCLQALHFGMHGPAPLLMDGTRIQRLVAERHGEQRAQLGLGEAALRREHDILRELLAQHLQRTFANGGRPYLREVIELVLGMVDQAKYTSALALRRAAVR